MKIAIRKLENWFRMSYHAHPHAPDNVDPLVWKPPIFSLHITEYREYIHVQPNIIVEKLDKNKKPRILGT
jgi:hypothetical protein